MKLMPGLKKLIILPLIIIILVLSFLFLSKNTTLADMPLSQEEYEQTIVPKNTSFTKEDADQATVDNIVHNLNIAVSGPVTPEGQRGLRNQGGAIAKVGGLIAQMIGNPPVATSEYLADLGSNLGLPIKSVQAQGIGWKALRPVLPVWKAFRNVTYIFFVIIFVVIGFMIMFRAKINPQTVISLQAALPKIVITLLLVTFSYAIAGLMIDLIYILIYLLVGIAKLGGLIGDSETVLNILFTRDPFRLVFDTQGGADIFVQGPGEAIQIILEERIGAWFKDVGLGELAGGVAKLILGIAVLFSLFKLFFSLLLSYLGIVLGVIFAPFNILFNALPGSNSFMGWLKNLFANIIVFPAVAGFFLIAAILIGPRGGASCGTQNNPWCIEQGIGFYPEAEKEGGEIWVPPFLTYEDKSKAGDVGSFQALIALGIIMMTPQIVTMIKKMLKVEPSGFGGAVVGGIMAGPKMIAAVPGTAFNLAGQMGFQPLRKPIEVITRPGVPPTEQEGT